MLRFAPGKRTPVLTYEDWYARLDQLAEKKFSLPLDWLPDLPFRFWYDQKFTPVRAIREAEEYLRELY